MKFKIVEYPKLGRGLEASEHILEGSLIHLADVIEINRKDSLTLQKTLLANYVFDIGRGKTGIALGYGSLFNHSDKANVLYRVLSLRSSSLGNPDVKRKYIGFYAKHVIPAGQQIILLIMGIIQMSDEIWTLARNFPNYLVSNTGKVKSVKGKFKKFYEVNGYWKVNLYKEGKEHKIRVNRLVKMSFAYRPDADSMDVDHIDFDRKNNNLRNLRWSVPKRNRSRKNV